MFPELSGNFINSSPAVGTYCLYGDKNLL